MTTSNAFPQCDVFLCHNRHDRTAVKQIAEGLELEFGIPHFLDDYSIPVGEAFLPWIENALANSRGCAVFLGPNGWGPTHLVEAEKALLRYRADPTFRLIPVVLGELRDEDAARLGNGTVFRDINWVQIAGGMPDLEAIGKLRAALTDKPVEGSRGPALLTPYLLRREALRWSESKNDDLLLRGRALEEAQRLHARASDLASGGEITEFLDRAARRAIGRLRRIVGVALATSVVLAVVATVAYYQRTIAESRQFAALALAAGQTEDALLLAVAAYEVWPTVESRASMLQLLASLRHADRILHGVGRGVHAVDIDDSSNVVVAGGEGGALYIWDLHHPEAVEHVFAAPSSNGIGENRIYDAAIIPGRDEVLVAYERGGLRVWSIASGTSRQIPGWPAPTTGTAQVHSDYYGPDPEPLAERGERAVKALALQPGSTFAAAVDTTGRVFLVDPVAGALLWSRNTDLYGLESVHWSPDGRFILVGNEDGKMSAFTPSGELVSMPALQSHYGRVLLVAVAPGTSTGTFLTLHASGKIVRWSADGNRLDLVGVSALPVSAFGAGLDPTGAHVFVTTRAGPIQSFDLDGGTEQTANALIGHRLTATSVRCQKLGHLCVSGGVGSDIFVWNLNQQHPLLARRVRAPGLISNIWRHPLDGIGILSQPDGALEWSSLTSEKRVSRPTGAIAAFSPRSDGNEIAIAQKNDSITVYPSLSAPDGTTYRLPHEASAQLYMLTISPSGHWLIAADNSPRIVVWQLERTAAPILVSPTPDHVSSIAIAPDERSFVAGTLSGDVLRWSLAPFENTPLKQHVAGGPIFALAYSQSGNRLFAGSGAADRNVRTLKPSSLELLAPFPEMHVASLSKLAVSQDDKVLASASDDGVVILWDMDSERELGALPHADDTIFQAMTFDGRERLLVSSDDTVFSWDVSDSALVASACRIANRTNVGEQPRSTDAIKKGIRLCAALSARR